MGPDVADDMKVALFFALDQSSEPCANMTFIERAQPIEGSVCFRRIAIPAGLRTPGPRTAQRVEEICRAALLGRGHLGRAAVERWDTTGALV